MAKGGARGVRAGRAFVELGVSDKLTAGLKRAQRKLRAFGQGVRNLGAGVAAAGAAILSPLIASTKIFASMGDQLNKMSARTGFAVEALSELKFAAEQSGTNIETLEKGVRRMQATINDAERGLSTATDALDDLGLSARQLRALSPEDQFTLIAEKLGGIEDPSKRAAVAMQVLGRAGTALLPLFSGGAAGLRKLREEAAALGITISTEDAQAAADLTDAFNRLWQSAKAGVFQIGAALAPTVTKFIGHVKDVAVTIANWIEQNRGLVVTVAAAGVAVLGTGLALVAAGISVQVLALAFGGLATILSGVTAAIGLAGSLFAGLLTPVGLVIGAVVGLGAAFVAFSGIGTRVLSFLSDQFKRFSAFVRGVVDGIADALAGGDVALAAKVLWAGLRVAWQAGIAPLLAAWEAFRFVFERLAINAFFAVKTAWLNFRNFFETNFPDFTAGVAKGWANLTADMATVWASLQNFLSDRWLEFIGLFDDTLDVDLAKQLGLDDLNDTLGEIEQKRKAAIREANRRAGRSDAERELELVEALAKVERERQAAVERAKSAGGKRLKDAQGALEVAKKELAAAREKAKAARDEAEAGALPVAEKRGADVAGIGAAVAQASRRISVGSFSARAGQLVVPTENIGQKLDRILDAIKQNKPVKVKAV